MRLKDMLESEVDEKFYLSDRMVKFLSASNEKWAGSKRHSFINKTLASAINTGEGSRRCDASNYISKCLQENADLKCIQVGQMYGEGNPQTGRIYDSDGLSTTVNTCQGGNRMPKVIDGIGGKKSNGGMQFYQQDRIYDGDVAISVTTCNNPNYAVESRECQVQPITQQNLRVRKLTPKECWRLMGFSDEDFEKAKSAGISDSQLYKQAGNSIVVDVVEAILRELIGQWFLLDKKN